MFLFLSRFLTLLISKKIFSQSAETLRFLSWSNSNCKKLEIAIRNRLLVFVTFIIVFIVICRLLTCHDRVLLYADNICCLAILKVVDSGDLGDAGDDGGVDGDVYGDGGCLW